MTPNAEITIKDRIVRSFAERILSGELKTGERLPGEREIAETMAASRSIVHLAMEQLEQLKLIEMKPRVGNFVRDYRRDGNFATLMLLAGGGDSAMDAKLTYALVELRNTIEGEALRSLARNGSEEDFTALATINETLQQAAAEGGDATELAAISRSFHMEIVRRCENPFYVMILNSFGDIDMPWVKCLAHWTPQGVYGQNVRLLELLRAGRGKEAAAFISEIFEQYKAEQ